mgnify:CR=1 FL=1
MTMDPDSVIKSFNVFENKPISVIMIPNSKAVKPFSFNQRMKGFNTGIIIGVAFVRIAAFHIFGGFQPGTGYILASTIRMNNEWQIGVSISLGFMNGSNNGGYFHGVRKRPGNDFSGE